MPKKFGYRSKGRKTAATAAALMMAMGGSPFIAHSSKVLNVDEDEMKPDEPSKEEVAHRIQLAEERRQKKNAKRLANFKKSRS